MSYLDQALAEIQKFEGSVPWMYLDTVGKVTVGVGLMLPNVAAAAALPFTTGNRTSTLGEITYDFTRVSHLPKAKTPKFYQTPNQPTLSPDFIVLKLKTVVLDFEAQVRQHIQKYDALPDPAKVALLDMAYNLGPLGLLEKFPHLIRDVTSGAYHAAATVCNRLGISDARNAWTKATFLAAANFTGDTNA